MWKAKRRKTVLFAKTFHPTASPRLFGSHFGSPQNISCRLATGERGHAPSAVLRIGVLFNNIELFRKQYPKA